MTTSTISTTTTLTDYVISDTHWYHNALIRTCGRPDNHTQLSIENWRKVVPPCATIYHLGDVILYKLPDLPDILRSLPGRKILVLGNHDCKTKTWYRRAGFEEVHDCLTVGDLLLTHRPSRYLPPGCVLNLHGHVHTRDNYTRYPHSVPVVLEHLNYTPARIADLIAPYASTNYASHDLIAPYASASVSA